MSSTRNTPASIASSAQHRAAAWNASRQRGLQNRCACPPLCRILKGRSHQTQAAKLGGEYPVIRPPGSTPSPAAEIGFDTFDRSLLIERIARVRA